jgi:hypothetical protein
MREPTQEQIERRVYDLWQQAGFPEGKDEDFRRQAVRELRNRECSVGALATKDDKAHL